MSWDLDDELEMEWVPYPVDWFVTFALFFAGTKEKHARKNWIICQMLLGAVRINGCVVSKEKALTLTMSLLWHEFHLAGRIIQKLCFSFPFHFLLSLWTKPVTLNLVLALQKLMAAAEYKWQHAMQKKRMD